MSCFVYLKKTWCPIFGWLRSGHPHFSDFFHAFMYCLTLDRVDCGQEPCPCHTVWKNPSLLPLLLFSVNKCARSTLFIVFGDIIWCKQSHIKNFRCCSKSMCPVCSLHTVYIFTYKQINDPMFYGIIWEIKHLGLFS